MSMMHESNSQTQDEAVNVHTKPPKYFMPIFLAVVVGTLIYIGIQLSMDLAHVPPLTLYTMVLTFTALFIALGFEFVNGFHDTANAVATVIYTNSLPAPVAVMWAGFCNFIGVLLSSGAVAYAIIALLPVELILNVGSSSGFAMVFALLLAAIIWNLGTWYFGIPASSSHTMIGSILGVGIANYLINQHNGIVGSGIDMEQVIKVGKALLFSPLIGFGLAFVTFILIRTAFKKHEKLFQAPIGHTPPPPLIRAISIFNCTGVSFAHGSNDGQKGMGLIMLILIGLLPTVYSLNKNIDQAQLQQFQQTSHQVSAVISTQHNLTDEQSRQVITQYIQTKQFKPEVLPAVASLSEHLGDRLNQYGDVKKIPETEIASIRNDLYLNTTAIKRLDKAKLLPEMSAENAKLLKTYRSGLDGFLQYIPVWVKIAVALALGLGTMVGWKRIVMTVGGGIGKKRMTYAQGISAELTAISVIASADGLGMPVSTTHILNSAVAGTMVANKSGLQKTTIKNIISAWILTLPATIILSGCLYWIFLQIL